jgi:aryl-alcohol dehydrogenase-like predicted oxidoreductase
VNALTFGNSIPHMRLGFGCVGLGSASGAGWRHDVRLVEEAVDRGVKLFDTADAYGGGMSERVLGRALRRRRADVVLATKAGYRFRERSLGGQSMRRAVGPVLGRTRRPGGGPATGLSGPRSGGGYRDQDFSPRYLRQAVDASLRRLGTDYVDVLQLHGPARVVPGLIDDLRELADAGKVRKIGVGAESVAVAADAVALAGVEVVQLPFGVLDPEAAEAVFPLVEGPAEIWARGALGGGLLKAAALDASAVRADPKWPRISALLGLSRRVGLSIDELAVGFVRARAEVSTLLLGMTTRDHLRRNLELMESPPLDADLVGEIWALVKGGDG